MVCLEGAQEPYTSTERVLELPSSKDSVITLIGARAGQKPLTFHFQVRPPRLLNKCSPSLSLKRNDLCRIRVRACVPRAYARTFTCARAPCTSPLNLMVESDLGNSVRSRAG